MSKPTTKGKKQGETQFFKDRLTKVFNAWTTQNPAKASPYYSKNPRLLFFDFAPLKYTGWSEYSRGVQKLFFDNMPPNSSRISEPHDFHLMHFGNGAVTVATFHFQAKMKDGTKIANDGRLTTVWEREGRKWVITHDHWSFPFSPG